MANEPAQQSPIVRPNATLSERARGVGEQPRPAAVIICKNVSIWYGQKQAIHGISLDIPKNRITAIIGPSGCGKSTLLRQLNRMNDFIDSVKLEGQILYQGVDLYGKGVDPVEVRRRIGMVFQKPNPFPKSIFQNIAWGPVINGIASKGGKGGKQNLEELVEKSLREASLWEEVKDRLNESGLALSGGQQQRLCIARALAMQPECILMDEPCSALDPVSTGRIEDLMLVLKERYTIAIVTHNMHQAARASDYTAFLEAGKLVEFGETENVFTRPKQQRTEDYVSGRFG